MSVKNRNSIVTDGLVFYVDAGNGDSYPGSGTTWSDLVGSNNGTFSATPTTDSGNGGSIVFDGVDDYAISSDSISFTDGGQRSFEVWIKPSSPYGNTWQSVIWTGQVANKKIFEILLGQNHPTEANFRAVGHYYGGGNSMIDVNNTYNVVPNQWNHIALTQSDTTHKIYVNGSLTATKTGTDITDSSSGQIRIAIEGYSAFDYCNASYGVCKYYTKELSATEITQNYNALKNRFI